jgi:signal transduction histidine kinase
MRSIQAKLILWISAVIVTVLLLGSVFIYGSVKQSVYDQVDSDLAQLLSMQMLELEFADGKVEHEWLYEIEQDAQRSLQDYVQVWHLGSRETLRSPALGAENLPKLGYAGGGFEYGHRVLSGGTRLRAVGTFLSPTIDESSEEILPQTHKQYMMVLARPVNAIDQGLHKLFWGLLIGMCLAVGLSVLVVVLVIRASLRPIQRLEKDVDAVDVNLPQHRLSLPDNFPVELDGLVRRYNDLFERIARVRLRERKFSANAAHELRTPLAGIRAVLEQAIARPREMHDYQERIASALEISESLGVLVNRLMWFSRLQSGTQSVELAEFELRPLLENRLELCANEQSERSLRLSCEWPPEAIRLQSDPTMVGILFGNLIGNAFTYADANSEVKLSVKSEACSVHVDLSNDASGLQTGDLEQLYEPFFRGDAARSSGGDHSGIGLALCHEISRLLGVLLNTSISPDGRFHAEVIFPQK